MRQSHSTIERELEQAGFGINEDGRPDAIRRARIASAIVGTGAYFGEREAARLRAHFANGYVGLAAIEAIDHALLDGSWKRIDDEVRTRERDRQHDPNEKTDPSHMRHVTERNPYGWAQPDRLRAQDHDELGRWNTYRQAMNLTGAEKRDAGARDYRVRGCTRWEVLRDKAHPTVEHDALAVAKALGQATPAEAVATAQREVYGEATP